MYSALVNIMARNDVPLRGHFLKLNREMLGLLTKSFHEELQCVLSLSRQALKISSYSGAVCPKKGTWKDLGNRHYAVALHFMARWVCNAQDQYSMAAELNVIFVNLEARWPSVQEVASKKGIELAGDIIEVLLSIFYYDFTKLRILNEFVLNVADILNYFEYELLHDSSQQAFRECNPKQIAHMLFLAVEAHIAGVTTSIGEGKLAALQKYVPLEQI